MEKLAFDKCESKVDGDVGMGDLSFMLQLLLATTHVQSRMFPYMDLQIQVSHMNVNYWLSEDFEAILEAIAFKFENH